MLRILRDKFRRKERLIKDILAQIDTTILGLEQKIASLSKYGVSYAASLELKPAVGLPIDAFRNASTNEIDELTKYCNLIGQSIEDFLTHIERDTIQMPHGDNREHYCAGFDFFTGCPDIKII